MKYSLDKWIKIGKKLEVIPLNITKENRKYLIDWIKLYIQLKE